MPETRLFLRKKERCLWLRQGTRLVAAFAVGIGCVADAGIASAAEGAASQVQMPHFTAAHIFTFLFLMLGPFKIIGPFAKITKGADAGLARKIALQSILFATLALLLAAFLGETILSKYGIPVPVLGLSAGIILFLVALLGILQQFTPPAPPGEETTVPAPTLKMALSPLAFPTIVTPYGIAALVVFLAVTPDLQGQLIIGAAVLAIMLLNLVVMLTTRRILPVMGLALPILGAVLGVVQVALGLQIIHNSFKALGIL